MPAIPEKKVCVRGCRGGGICMCVGAFVIEEFTPSRPPTPPHPPPPPPTRLPVPLKAAMGHLSCTFCLEAIMGRTAAPLSLFGLLLAVVTALPVRVRKELDLLSFSWQMQMRVK